MKIKRFFAADMKQAIRMVREDIGPDAVILSNKKVRGGIEIIASLEYEEVLEQKEEAFVEREATMAASSKHDIDDSTALAMTIEERAAMYAAREEAAVVPTAAVEPKLEVEVPVLQARTERKSAPVEIEWSPDPALSGMQEEIQRLRGMVENQLTGLAWGEMGRSQPQRTELIRRLTGMGLQIDLVRELVDHVASISDVDQAWRQLLLLLAKTLPVSSDDDFLDHGGVVALVGSTGVGKTTTIAKLAARYALRHGSKNVAMVTTDSYRIGAHEQLRTYGQILSVPVHVASDADSLKKVLKSLSSKKLVLIDTAGMSQRDIRLSEQFATLQGGSALVQIYLVLSATAQKAVVRETVKAYQGVDLDGCIVTKIDESASLGGVMSAAIQSNMPLAYVTDGQRVPEDIHPARAHTLVKRAVEFQRAHDDMIDDEELALAYGGKLVHAHAR
ncbi:flagellar biosynthesis protein FlhF [Solemya pervernicosa gill symbiont]|uniref:Flagellar biosynthesis protein FlhF n=1 Tax=Solemya pervernicosa gill symbiont TaxID=642797 RepID=A0A1T2LAK2_9GAMM|nr:flagellar biosynthesis protein FlhF [Solemya pervernicosa gill symbiont]OOZ42138.1 flagellar biosynthesis protein FlhF [Solemya pervernicosa gill symbiont]